MAENKNPMLNAEGYPDPTAYYGIKAADRENDAQQKRVNDVIFVIKKLLNLCGFELLNRIEIKDMKTGRVYK